MASTCISNCVDARAPVRATYVNLYKWPESDVEFIRSLSSNKRRNGGGGVGHPKVVDSISCRQLYLRSYTFSRDDEFSDQEKRKRSCRRFRERVAANRTKRRLRDRGSSRGSDGYSGGRRKRTGLRKAKEVSCIALASIFRRLLSCTIKVDVVG